MNQFNVLINPCNCFTRTYLKSSQHLKIEVFVVLLVCDLQPAINVTKNSLLRVAGVLDLTLLELINVF